MVSRLSSPSRPATRASRFGRCHRRPSLSRFRPGRVPAAPPPRFAGAHRTRVVLPLHVLSLAPRPHKSTPNCTNYWLLWLTADTQMPKIIFNGILSPGMAFQLSDEQRAIREAVRDFGENEITPVAREHDEEKKYPADLVEGGRTTSSHRHPGRVRRRGDGPPLESHRHRRTLARGRRYRERHRSRGFGTNMIQKFGDEWMKEEWLPRIAAGESPLSCISEPAHGSNVAGNRDARRERRRRVRHRRQQDVDHERDRRQTSAS